MPAQFPFFLKATIILLGIVLLVLVLYIGANLIVPLLFSMFMAILLNPISNFLERKKIPRVLAIFIALLIGLVVVSDIVALIVFQITIFTGDSDVLRVQFNAFVRDSLSWCAQIFNVQLHVVNQRLNDMEMEVAQRLMQNLGGTISTLGSLAIVVFVIPVYVFLLLYYKPLFIDFIAKIFHKQHHETVSSIMMCVNTILKSYLLGLLIETSIIATLNSVGLLVIGIKYALLLGICGAVLNLIPYIGGMVAITLPVAIALLTKSPMSALFVLGLYAIIQFIDNNFLVPAIVGSRVKINALASILAVLAGGLLWGIAGMFMAIPLTALIKVVFDHIDNLKPWGLLLGDSMPESDRSFLLASVHKKISR